MLETTLKELKKLIPHNTFEQFITHENKIKEKTFILIKNNNIKKFIKLKNKYHANKNNNISINQPDKWIKNLTETKIPINVQNILALGPNFAHDITTSKEIPTFDLIANTETLLKSVNPTEVENIRGKIINTITNYTNIIKHNTKKQNPFQKNLNKNVKETQIFLKTNPNLLILKPDKCNSTVIMEKTDYHNKLTNQLKDKNIYKPLKLDPTSKYQNKNNEIVKNWLQKHYIDNITAHKLTIHNAQPPKIYGLPKLHKINIPLRPIISCNQSPLYNLSKFMSNILSNIINNNPHYIKDSFHFKNFINSITIPENHSIFSLDIVSLYTNIPNELIINVITKKWSKISEHTKIPKQEFLNAIKLVVNTNYFQYHNNFYQQIDGCAMGSPLSSTIAQIVMEYVEETIIKDIKQDILFFKRYVDDCICIAPTNKITEIHSKFNNFHNKLQFTIEIEKNNKLNFLDLTLIKHNNIIHTSWNTKDIHSGRYLNYLSQHPLSQKKGTIISLVDRAIKLTSPHLRQDILQNLENTLTQNNYPKTLIKKIIKTRVYLHYNHNTTQKEPTNKLYTSFPFIKNLSSKIQKIVKNQNIILAYKPSNTLSNNFSKLKSKIPKLKNTHLIYEIPCNNCDKTYIGMTTQYLEKRLQGHKYNKHEITTLKKHTHDTKHNFNFNNTKILKKDNNYNNLTIFESLYIKQSEHAVNNRSETININNAYDNLIELHTSNQKSKHENITNLCNNKNLPKNCPINFKETTNKHNTLTLEPIKKRYNLRSNKTRSNI